MDADLTMSNPNARRPSPEDEARNRARRAAMDRDRYMKMKPQELRAEMDFVASKSGPDCPALAVMRECLPLREAKYRQRDVGADATDAILDAEQKKPKLTTVS